MSSLKALVHTEHVSAAGRHAKISALQVITHLELGGAEEVAISLTEALHEEVDFRFFVVRAGPRSAIGESFYQRLRACGVPISVGTRLPMKLGGALVAGAKLSRLIRRYRPDVVHLHTEIPEMTYSCATLFGLPSTLQVVRTIHNTTLWPVWNRVGAWSERRLTKAHVAAVSHGGLQGLSRFHQVNGLPHIPESRSEVIYAGVSRGSCTLPEVPVRPVSPIRVLVAGRFEWQKGVDLLPSIVSQAMSLTDRAVQLHVAGRGQLGAQLEDWAAQLSAAWEVRILPPIPNLADHLKAGHYDLVFMPSRFEGLNLVAVEAMLAGVPVVATRIAGLREIFPDDYPLLAPPGDTSALAVLLAQAIERVEDFRTLARSLQPAIQAKFSLSVMGTSYLQLYQRATLANGQP